MASTPLAVEGVPSCGGPHSTGTRPQGQEANLACTTIAPQEEEKVGLQGAPKVK